MKKRIAIYYSTKFGRNDGPPLYYCNRLKDLEDTEIVHLIPEGDTRRYGKFDYHFWVDWGEDGLPVDPFWMPVEDNGIRIYVCSDAHINPDAMEYRFKKAHQFDYVFFNQKRFMPEFAQWNKSNTPKDSRIKSWHYLPHAVEPQAYPYTQIIKKYDIAFIGHIQETENHNGMTRIDSLDLLFKEFPNFYYGTRHPAFPEKNMFEHAAMEFSKARIVFNISIKDDLNMRLFESMASGSFQLTNELPFLDELFQSGKHLGTYSSYKDLIDKVHYYLDNEDEREEIALAGYQEVIAKHTYKHRIQTIFDTLEKEGIKDLPVFKQ